MFNVVADFGPIPSVRHRLPYVVSDLAVEAVR